MSDKPTKAIPVRMTLPDIWQLESIAERRGLTLPEFLYKSALAVAGASRESKDAKETIVILHEAGLTVPQIARRLDMTNISVRSRLVRLGFQPNVNRKAS